MSKKTAIKQSAVSEVESGGNLTPKFLTVVPAAEGDGLDFVLGNGKKLTFDPSKCSEAVQRFAMRHGFNQKIRDAAAGFSKGSDFSGAFAEMADVIESLYNGDWNRRGGIIGSRMEDLAQALASIKNASIDAARAAVAKASPEQREVWMKNAKVKLAVEQARLARMQAAAASDNAEIEVDL